MLAEAGESIERFVGSGIAELGAKLGPIVWQFAPTKRFEPDDFEAFLELLPAPGRRLPLRHVLDVRHESFMTPEYLALARRYGVATVFTDSDDYPSFADLTGRLRLRAADAHRVASSRPATAGGAGRVGAARAAVGGGAEPDGLPRVEPPRRRESGRAARRLHVLHQRREGTGAGGGDGIDRRAVVAADDRAGAGPRAVPRSQVQPPDPAPLCLQSAPAPARW